MKLWIWIHIILLLSNLMSNTHKSIAKVIFPLRFVAKVGLYFCVIACAVVIRGTFGQSHVFGRQQNLGQSDVLCELHPHSAIEPLSAILAIVVLIFFFRSIENAYHLVITKLRCGFQRLFDDSIWRRERHRQGLPPVVTGSGSCNGLSLLVRKVLSASNEDIPRAPILEGAWVKNWRNSKSTALCRHEMCNVIHPEAGQAHALLSRQIDFFYATPFLSTLLCLLILEMLLLRP
jgi:hypothetical protein